MSTDYCNINPPTVDRTASDPTPVDVRPSSTPSGLATIAGPAPAEERKCIATHNVFGLPLPLGCEGDDWGWHGPAIDNCAETDRRREHCGHHVALYATTAQPSPSRDAIGVAYTAGALDLKHAIDEIPISELNHGKVLAAFLRVLHGTAERCDALAEAQP